MSNLSACRVTLLIPLFYPEDSFFTRTIPLLKRQTLVCKIVLISSSGELLTGEYDSVVIDQKDFNHANTRNMVLEHESDFYMFMTQDALPVDETLIEKLLEPFVDKDVVVSYARQIPYADAHITERFAREKNYPETSMIKCKDDLATLGIKTFFTSDSCAMYRADYFREKGGFKRDLNTSEDMEFAARAIFDNKKIAYCAEAKVYHSHLYTPLGLFKRYRAIGLFFKNNSWIEASVEKMISTTKTGRGQVLAELRYIAAREPFSLVKSFVFALIKYLGYTLGKKY